MWQFSIHQQLPHRTMSSWKTKNGYTNAPKTWRNQNNHPRTPRRRRMTSLKVSFYPQLRPGSGSLPTLKEPKYSPNSQRQQKVLHVQNVICNVSPKKIHHGKTHDLDDTRHQETKIVNWGETWSSSRSVFLQQVPVKRFTKDPQAHEEHMVVHDKRQNFTLPGDRQHG